MAQVTPKKASSNHNHHSSASSRPELEQQVRELEDKNRDLAAQVAALQQAQIGWQLNEAVLRESEVRLQILANLVPSMVWTASPDGAMTYANDRWFDYVGLTPEQNARQWPDLVLHPDDRDRCLRQWTHALQTGTEYEIEVRTRRYDGLYHWFLTRAVPLRNAEGQITAWLGVSIDIHDHKEAERRLRESETQLRLIMDTVPGLMAHIDRNQCYQFVNAAYERWYNLSHEQIIGRPIREIIGPVAYEQLRPGIEAALAGEPVSVETTISYAEGHKTVLSTYVPHRDADGQPSGFYALVMDISARKQAELAQHLLAEAGKVLASSLDYTVRLSNVAHLAVPHLADWCAVDIFEDDGSVHHIAVAHTDPAKVALAHQLRQRYPPRQDVIKAKARPWLRGQAELYPEITEAILHESAQDAEHYQILRDLHLQSAMVVPLMAQERVVGMMLFVWAESGYRYSEQDLTLAEELARRAAIALENARTYQAEQVARQTAEQIAERIASLQIVTTRLSQAVSSAQIAEIVLTHGLATIGINAGLIALLTDDGTEFELLASIGYPDQVMTHWRRFPVRPGIPMADVLQSGQPIYVSSHGMREALYPAISSETAHAAWAVMPLVVEGRAIGGLSFSFPEPHEFSPEEREFGLTLASQCAQALERARLYEAEQMARAKAEAAQESVALLAEMRERQRLAQELHDNVAQVLGYLNIKVSQLHTQFVSNQLDKAEVNLHELKQVIGEAYTDIRGEIFNLRTTSSAEVKFLDTLRRYIDKYKRFYRLDIHLQLETDEAQLDFPPEVSMALIRTIQEALMNVYKHAQVEQALIQISRKGQLTQIRVEDEGRGFNRSTAKEGSFGLKIMQERMGGIGGRLEIESQLDQGTQVTLFYTEDDPEI